MHVFLFRYFDVQESPEFSATTLVSLEVVVVVLERTVGSIDSSRDGYNTMLPLGQIHIVNNRFSDRTHLYTDETKAVGRQIRLGVVSRIFEVRKLRTH